ncbi:DUF389 domain-containing protein [Planctomycetota bacterium]
MLQKWVTFRVTEERRIAVYKEISEGSTPAPRFYFMVVASNMIAVLGLMSNSPAVIIGAMLVAPLMTPIFGIALALIRGAPSLLGRALRAEVLGVSLCIAISFLFGLVPMSMELTTEMLGRSQPNLLDLLVAVFAGLAGSYAMVDERISPTLPGVAIATAIVPPLANTGLCFALGEINGGFGSFFLFLANFFSILIAASVVFASTGMATFSKKLSPSDLARRFGVAVVSLSIIAVVFTYSLVRLVNQRYLRQSIKTELIGAMTDIPGSYMREFMWERSDDGLHILATVRTPQTITPNRVADIQNQLSQALGRPIHLIIRNNPVKDIAASGSTSQVAAVEQEGEFLADKRASVEQKISLAEQVLWEHFSKWPGFNVLNTEYRKFRSGDLIVASVENPYPFTTAELLEVEQEIRDRTNNPNVQLTLSRSKPEILDDNGPLFPEWVNYEDWSGEEEPQMAAMKRSIADEIAAYPNVFLTRCHFRLRESGWKILMELTGLQALPPKALEGIRQRVSARHARPFELYAWFRPGTVITSEGYQSYDDFIKGPMEYNKRQWEQQ